MTEPQEVAIEKSGEDLQRSQESLGEVLLAARNAKNLTQQDVSNSLRFSVKQIDALENNAFDLLPDAVITRGFIRNYARLLEIDAEPLLASYRASVTDDESKHIAVRSSMLPVQLSKDSQPWLKYILGSILVLLLLLSWLFYMDYMPKNRAVPVEKPAVADENKSVREIPLPEIALPAAERQASVAEIAGGDVNAANTQSGATPEAVMLPQAELKPAAENSSTAQPLENAESLKDVQPAVQQVLPPAGNAADKKITMTFTEQTWVSMTDKSGKVVYEKMSHAGDTEAISVKPPLNVVIGNARATKLVYSGQNVELTAHTRSNVARITLE